MTELDGLDTELDDLDLERALACWAFWRGVTGVFYARRMRSSPPVVFRSETMDDLREQVKNYLLAGKRP